MKFAKTSLRARRAFGMFDVLLAVTFALGLIAGIIMLYNQTQLASNTTDTSRALAAVSAETRSLYRTAPDFAGLDMDQLIAAGAIPSALLTDSDADGVMDVVNAPYGGLITLTAPAAGDQSFQLVVDWTGNPTGKTSAICERLAAPIGDGGVGPLGTDYSIDAGTDCAAGTLEVTFTR